MTLAPGSRLGPYEILGALGAGGMGEVYRARDTRLGRNVAIKVLPTEFAFDPERLRRFEQEARAASALNHPNIVVVFDVGSAKVSLRGAEGPEAIPPPTPRPLGSLAVTEGVEEIEVHYLVEELLEGESLRERVAGGAVPPRKVLEYGVQIAQGLAAAHEKGIVHRDLKPENLFVTSRGHVKILDFGLAKLVEPPLSPDRVAEAPTRTGATAVGIVLGTVGYMAPEQVRGQFVDHRADIFALGCVLYEMLTGRRAFKGETQMDTLSAILSKDPPPLASIVAEISPALQGIVVRCLEKRPGDRFSSAHDLALALGVVSSPSQGEPGARVEVGRERGKRRRWRLALAVAAGLLTLGILGALWLMRRGGGRFEPANFQLVSTFPGSHSSPTFSPDASTIAFVDDFEGVPQIWLKNLAQGDPVRITSGTVGAVHPRWSPRGDRILFHRGNWKVPGGIWSVPPLGGEPQRIIESGWNASFSGNGERIVFERQDGLFLAAPDGSEEHRVEGVPANFVEGLDLSPALSPDGKWVAYFMPMEGPRGDFWVIPATGGKPREVTADLCFGGTLTWTPDSRFMIVSSERGGGRTLWRVPVGGGDPQPVTTGAGEDREPAVSLDGRKLIYTNERVSYALMMLDTATGQQRQLLERRATVSLPSFSPDGNRIAFMIDVGSSSALFTIGSDGNGLRQLPTPGRELYVRPQWSHDGASLFYYQVHPGHSFRKMPVAGGSRAEIIADWSWARQYAAQLDPQDRRVAYTMREVRQAKALVVSDLATGKESRLSTVLWEPQWSADGNYLLGTSIDETQVVLCPLDGGGCAELAAGFWPLWSGDGSRIFFHRPGGSPELTEVWVMGRDGRNPRRVGELRSKFDISFSALSRRDQLAWVQVRRGRQELWLAELAR